MTSKILTKESQLLKAEKIARGLNEDLGYDGFKIVKGRKIIKVVYTDGRPDESTDYTIEMTSPYVIKLTGIDKKPIAVKIKSAKEVMYCINDFITFDKK